MVLCQTDDRVLQTDPRMAPPPTSSRRSTTSSRGKSTTDYSGSATSTGSCLVIPGFARRRKNRRKLSSATSTDQSSTAEHIFNPMANNDRQQLLLRNSNQVTADWFEDDIAMSSEASTNFKSSQPSVVTPNSDQSPPLLSFPTPKDRSHHARRTMNQQKGVMHAYDGEMEPEGVRGQEARVTPVGNQRSNELPLRTFTGTPRPLLPVRPSEEDYSNEEEEHHYDETPPDHQLKSQRVQRMMSDVSNTSSQDLQSMIKTEFSGSNEPRGEYHHADNTRMMRQPIPEAPMKPREDPYHSPYQMPRSPPSRSQPPQERAPPRTPQRRGGVEESFSSSEDPDFKVPRKSAPVNVDDSSFEDPGTNVQGIHAMAMEHVMRGEFDMALQAFSQVLSVYLEKFGRAHPLTASAYHNLGTVHSKRAGLLLDHTLHQRHCREQALLCFQAAARSARDSPQLGPSHPNVAVSLVRIGFLLLQSRQYQNAVITFQEALRIRLDHYGPTHALVANLYNNLGVCHMHVQEFVVGRRYLQQALDIQKDLLGQDEFSTTALLELADTLCNIGGLCLEWIRQQGPDPRHALDAESAFLEALEVRAKVLGENHALTNQVRSLHDMVRSIPLPKVADNTGPRSPKHAVVSPARSARSPNSATVTSPSSPGRPYATASTPAVSPPRPSTAPTSTSQTPEALNLPSLEKQRDMPNTQRLEKQRDMPNKETPEKQREMPNKQTPEKQREMPNTQRKLRQRQDPPALEFHNNRRRPSPPGEFDPEPDAEPEPEPEPEPQTDLDLQNDTNDRITPMNRSAQSELESTYSSMISDAELNAYEATEENCILDTQQEDGQMTVVSYAQSTASWSSATRKETERLAYLMQAKAILDAHRDHMDSPQLKLDKKEGAGQARTGKREPESMEDGLAPLGGEWPEVTLDRISPDVLENPMRHLKTIHNSACSFFKRGRYSEALHLLEIVADTQRSRNGPVHEDVGAALHNVGVAELRLGENYKALQAFEEAVRVRKGALGRDHPQVAVSLVKVGITLMLLKRLKDSLWIFREALTVRKHALGPLHPSTARIYNNIGCVHVEFGESKDAKRAFEAALDIQRNALVHDPESGPILFGAATTLQNLAYLYRKNDMREKEAMVLRESLGIQEKVLGTLHPAVMGTLESLALACSLSDHEDHALKYYNECLERLYEQDDETREQQAGIMYKMSRIHGSLDDRESQTEKLHLAVKILRADKVSPEGENLIQQIELERVHLRKELDRNAPNWV